MKAIKERAEKALESYDWNIYYHYSELTEDSFKEGYVQGVKEQKVIDKERMQNNIIRLFKENDGAEINGSWWDTDEIIDFLLR